MLRKCMCFVCALWLLPLLQVSAAEGSIQVIPMRAGEPVAGGTVSVRKIGRFEEDRLVLTDGLANWGVATEDILGEAWDLKWIGPVQTAVVEDGLGAVFTGLEEGVYRVSQETAAPGSYTFRPFLVSVPTDGRWDILRRPGAICDTEAPQTGDHPAPIIGAMGIGLSVAFLMVLVDKNNR